MCEDVKELSDFKVIFILIDFLTLNLVETDFIERSVISCFKHLSEDHQLDFDDYASVCSDCQSLLLSWTVKNVKISLFISYTT